MKKSNNKGFSLVELIIVIAIMAILAGAIAPALIRYIDKSRKSNDLSAAKTIKTAVETAMSNEDTYAGLTSLTGSACIELTAGGTTVGDVSIDSSVTWPANAQTSQAEAEQEIFDNLSQSVPKVKYKKAADGTNTPVNWYVECSTTGQVTVYLGDSSTYNMYELVPNTSKYYQ